MRVLIAGHGRRVQRTDFNHPPPAAHDTMSRTVFYVHNLGRPGMEAGARQNAQNSFTRGKARIVVATVAFGLGVDMRDIRGVVHFDMPKSIENYVQVCTWRL